MPRFPSFGFPYQYPYYNRYYNSYNYHKTNIKKDTHKSDIEDIREEVQAQDNENTNTLNRSNTKISSKNNQLLPFNFDFNGFSDSDKPLIEILGIKLFLDDIIILGLLFLLYKEGVKDEMLFIALILLLLT